MTTYTLTYINRISKGEIGQKCRSESRWSQRNSRVIFRSWAYARGWRPIRMDLERLMWFGERLG